MKKFTALFFGFLLFTGALSAEENLLSFSIGLSTGVPIYGSESVDRKLSSFTDQNHRIILGGLGSVNLNLVEPVTFFAGTDFLADFNWSTRQFLNVLDFDMNTGIKIYPGLGGLNLGLAYCLGYSVNYSGLRGPREKTYRAPSPWGNGFKFLMEYNFAHDGFSNFLPTAGFYWKWMPRGSNYHDNYLCAYVSANF